ncbi:hypothetical protein P3T76_005265 [Phytophthora citrophthora]|uniref:Uncharacterized protein n=1 Tax=Phytophthora citrophthora TaxID=4793 RepID=A0AAD9LR77_9STRA|nr:hypothetical protein P3T76_005265 [Phytophthora citrophthora]
MEFGTEQFPTLTPRISELYGANGGAYRVGEADAYAQDLDELEREERALENTVQELVNRQAPVPIGVKFHRERDDGNVVQQAVVTEADSFNSSDLPPDSGIPFLRSSSSEGEEDLDLDEDEMMEEDESDEDETTGRATIVRGEGPQREEDSFSRDMESGNDSMDMEEELPPPSDWH